MSGWDCGHVFGLHQARQEATNNDHTSVSDAMADRWHPKTIAATAPRLEIDQVGVFLTADVYAAEDRRGRFEFDITYEQQEALERLATEWIEEFKELEEDA